MRANWAIEPAALESTKDLEGVPALMVRSAGQVLECKENWMNCRNFRTFQLLFLCRF